MSGKKYLCIHGHFYQPPREDAWTNEINPQPSAAPFHDWNERIFQECYKPNANAVIVDNSDNVITKVNNYAYLSFNFGPTLLQWIKRFHSKTYQLIIDADKISIEKHKGHGNAIAMVYNHIIMPLASERDKITQIKWGVEDFMFHFNREPEAIWLSETACNQATIEALIEEDIKYIILDPSQAEKIRKAKRGKWKDVSNGSINPKIAYRCYSEVQKDKFINIFFYDGPLSRNIAFDDHIYDATKLVNRIFQNVDVKCKADQLISSAIDGETFGHHKHFAERTLAYLFYELAQRSGFNVTNFGEYLADHPAEYEVKIKPGRDGEGTSWSCVHGVGRWKEDCGCSGGGEDGWNQKWRTPLRDSLNWLRDEIAMIYEEIGSHFLKNVWDARNDYIKVILKPDLKIGSEFFYNHAKRYLSADESMFCIKLLEMQRYGLLMFTSCGWFFSDVSGIETIQIIQYAARAIELAHEVSGVNLENEFLEKLAEAKSNKPDAKDGREIYLRHFAKRIPVGKN